MRIAVLGPLEVVTDDLAPVQVPGAKERLLLTVLAAGAPGVVSRDPALEACAIVGRDLTQAEWDTDLPARDRAPNLYRPAVTRSGWRAPGQAPGAILTHVDRRRIGSLVDTGSPRHGNRPL